MKFPKWMKYLVVLFVILFISACSAKPDKPVIVSIQIDPTSIIEDIDLDQFELSNIMVVVNFSDGTTKKIPLSSTMLSTEDLSKLSTIGSHLITVHYESFTTTLNINLIYQETKMKMYLIYQLALQSESTTLTFEEWIDSIRGDDGIGIVDASIDSFGHLILLLSNEEQIDVGKVVGMDGKQVVFQISSSYIQWKYQGDSIWNNLISIDDLIGDDGLGIDNIEINNAGELIITYTDHTTRNLGTLYRFYIVQFKGMNGVVLDTQILISGESAIAPTAPQIEGYIFTGWSEDLTNITSNLVIDAQYRLQSYTIEFDAGPSIPIDPIENILYNQTVTLPNPVKQGYVFKGWFLGTDANSMPFYNESLVKESMTLYAKWELANHTVTFLDYDSTLLKIQYVTHHMSATPPESPKRLGYVFVGWDQQILDITEDTIVIAQYELGKYNIYFESDGGSGIIPIINVTYGSMVSLPISIKPDYDFMGWKYQEDLFINEIQMPAHDITLTAIWEDHFYQIILNSNSGNPINNLYVVRYSMITSLPTPVKTGFVFEGWMKNNQVISTPFTFTDGNDMTLTAKWRGTTNNIEYVLMDGYAIIVGYTGSAATLILPDSIDDIAITEIADGVFMNKSLLINVTVGNFVRKIGNDAFRYCTSLTNVTLSKETTEIGTFVFFGTSNLSTITISSKMGYELKYLFGDVIANIPPSLTKIIYASGETTLNKTLLQGYLPDIIIQTAADMTIIPDFYFTDAISLKTILLSSGITSIGKDAFRNTQLSSIVIPSTVLTIGQGAFYGLTTLTSLEFEANSMLHTIGLDAFYGNTGLTQLHLPATLKKILGSAFSQCTNLLSVTFEEGNLLEEIGSMAFYNNAKIDYFEVTPHLTFIGSMAFYNNDELEYFVIPDSVTSLGNSAFAFCYDLIIFAEPLEKPAIWNQTFNPGGRPIYWGFEAFGEKNGYRHVLFGTGEAGIFGLSDTNVDVNLTLPSTYNEYYVTSIIAKAFYENTNIQSVNIPYTIHEIGEYAFYSASELTTVTFSGTSNLKKIEKYAFYNATKLESFVLPAGLETIGVLAFRSTKLSSVVIPASVISLGNGTFENCTYMESVTFEDGIALTSIEGYTFSSNRFDFIIIPDSVTNIGNFAFSNNTRLTSIVIPSTVVTMGQKVFYSSGNINIYAQASSAPVGWHADWNFNNYPVVWGVGDLVTDYNLRAVQLSDETWAVVAVIDKSVTDLIIPIQINGYPVHNITKSTLRGMSNLVNLTIPFVGADRYATGGNALFGYIFGGVSYTGSSITVQYYSADSNLVYFIPNSLSYVSVTNSPNIHYGAFYNCVNLHSVILHSGVTTVGANAFKGCSNVTIYSYATEQPIGWDALWNPDSRPVVWNLE